MSACVRYPSTEIYTQRHSSMKVYIQKYTRKEIVQ